MHGFPWLPNYTTIEIWWFGVFGVHVHLAPKVMVKRPEALGYEVQTTSFWLPLGKLNSLSHPPAKKTNNFSPASRFASSPRQKRFLGAKRTRIRPHSEHQLLLRWFGLVVFPSGASTRIKIQIQTREGIPEKRLFFSQASPKK